MAVIAFAATAGCASSQGEAWVRGADAAEGLPAGTMVVATYEGKYAADARLAAALARLRSTLPSAMDRLRRRLGDDLAAPAIGVCVVDGETTPISADVGTTPGEGYAGASVRTTRGRAVGIVVLSSEVLVTDSSDLEATLTHEFVHVLHETLGGYEQTPVWVTEGIALWVELEREADRDDYVLSDAIRFANGPRRKPLEDLLESERVLESADYRGQCAAGTIVFAELEKRKGVDSVRRLVRHLLRKGNWKDAFVAECGETVQQVLVYAKRAYDVWTASMATSKDFLKSASRKNSEGDYIGVLADVQRVLSDESQVRTHPWAQALRWSAQRLSGDLEAAQSSIHAFRANHPHHELVVESWLEELEILRQEGRWSEVEATARAVQQDFLWPPEFAAWRKYVDEMRIEALAMLAARK